MLVASIAAFVLLVGSAVYFMFRSDILVPPSASESPDTEISAPRFLDQMNDICASSDDRLEVVILRAVERAEEKPRSARRQEATIHEAFLHEAREQIEAIKGLSAPSELSEGRLRYLRELEAGYRLVLNMEAADFFRLERDPFEAAVATARQLGLTSCS